MPESISHLSMGKEDILLLVVASAKDEPLTPVQLQKSLFLIDRECRDKIPVSSFYDFEPYHYGPFDAEVYQDADILAEKGMVLRFQSDKGAWMNTISTHSGRVRAEQLKKEIAPHIVQYIGNVVDWAQGLSFRELVASIYQAYPEYKVKSVFRGNP